jgi:hypothetical protein
MIQYSTIRHLSGLAALLILTSTTTVNSQEVVVLAGTEQAMEWLESEDWWGEENRNKQLTVPNAIITGISGADQLMNFA